MTPALFSPTRLRLLFRHLPKTQSVRSIVFVATIINSLGVPVREYSLAHLKSLGRGVKKAKEGDIIITDNLAYYAISTTQAVTISPNIVPSILTVSMPQGSIRRVI